jgi:hypothetical protein
MKNERVPTLDQLVLEVYHYPFSAKSPANRLRETDEDRGKLQHVRELGARSLESLCVVVLSPIEIVIEHSLNRLLERMKSEGNSQTQDDIAEQAQLRRPQESVAQEYETDENYSGYKERHSVDDTSPHDNTHIHQMMSNDRVRDENDHEETE